MTCKVSKDRVELGQTFSNLPLLNERQAIAVCCPGVEFGKAIGSSKDPQRLGPFLLA